MQKQERNEKQYRCPPYSLPVSPPERSACNVIHSWAETTHTGGTQNNPGEDVGGVTGAGAGPSLCRTIGRGFIDYPQQPVSEAISAK